MKEKKVNEKFANDYRNKVLNLYKYLLPVLEAGWTEKEVLGLLLFMEKNPNKVRGKNIQEVAVLYGNQLIKQKNIKKTEEVK